MSVDRMLASNEALGCALLVVLLLAAYGNRIFLRDVATDPDRFWRVVARLALVSAGALIGWVSVADNWRQLTGLPYHATQEFASKRVEYDPPSASVRQITAVLLGIAVIMVASLVARHVGGYLLQIVMLLAAVAFWAPLFAIRTRLNVSLAFGFEGRWTSPLDVGGYDLFVVLAWLFEIALIMASFGVILAAIAVPVTLVLDLFRRRKPRTTSEATAFFGSLSQRAGTSGRVP